MPSVSERPEAPCYPNSSCRQFCLFGTQPLHLADHIAVAGLRRENVEASRGRRGAADALFGAQAEGVGADRKILSDRRHSGSGSRRLLASSGAAKRRRRKPCRRSVVDRDARADGRSAKTDRIDGEALLRALLAYKRGEPRVCAIVKAPTPEEEDRRRLCREPKVLIAERVKHVNRVKGTVVFPRRLRLRAVAPRSAPTAGRPVAGRRPSHAGASSRPRSGANSIGSNCCFDQIKEAEAERDKAPARRATARRASAGREDVARIQGHRRRVGRRPLAGGAISPL